MGYTVWPLANGNWSTAANWSGGSVPTIDDDIYLNGKTVTADQNMSCYTLKNVTARAVLPNMEIPTMVNNNSGAEYSTTLSVGIANASSNAIFAWQAFAFPTAATHWASTTTNTGWVSYQFPTGKVIKRYNLGLGATAAARPKDWTFEGSNDGSSWTTLDTVTGAASAAYTSGILANITSYTYYRINITAVQTLGNVPRITCFEMTESTSTNYSTATGGNLTIGDSYNFNSSVGIGDVSTTIINITAGAGKTVGLSGNTNLFIPDYTCTTGSTITITSNPTVNISGVFRSYDAASINGSTIIVSGAATINYIGDLNQNKNAATNAVGNIRMAHINSILNITGNITGQLNSANPGLTGSSCIYTIVGVVVNITGNIIAGFTPPVSGAGNINITGTCTAYNATNGSAIYTTGTVTLDGTATNTNGVNAIFAQNIKLKSTSQIVWTFQDELGASKVLYSSGAGSGVGMPNQADVRDGIVYGAASELEGTLIVPDVSNVRKGVLVDNALTEGTAADLTAEDFLAEIENSSSDLAVRLRNVATVQSTAATVSAYNG